MGIDDWNLLLVCDRDCPVAGEVSMTNSMPFPGVRDVLTAIALIVLDLFTRKGAQG